MIIGNVIGAGLKAAGSIFGNIAAARAMKRAKKNIEDQKKANEDWYNRRFNEDATQRGDAQRVLTQVRDDVLKLNRQAAGAQAVMGGSEESVAAAKAANSAALSQAASDIALSGVDRKDSIEAQYQAKDTDLNNQLVDMERARAGQVMQAGAQAGQLGAGIAASFMPKPGQG